MGQKGIIILGTARAKGNTHKIVSLFKEHSDFDLVDLLSLKFSGYDYDYQNKSDEFIPLMRNIASNYDIIIFATPVYWYAMSGIMKNFFDRITDCIRVEKEIGRKLRGKNMGMLSCGSDSDLKRGFEMPFEESAKYLGMNYLGSIHTWIEEEGIPSSVEKSIINFIERNIKVNKIDK